MGTSIMKEKLENGNVSIATNDLGIYVIKIESEGATESLWADQSELLALRQLLDKLDISKPGEL